jgi:DNA polymerase-1
MYRNPNHRYPPFTLRQSLQLSETLIMSGDRDVLQLINNTTNVLLQLNKSSKTIDNFYNCARMLNEYNIAPNYFVQLKALMGDNSDNIKGAIGFGEKTALTMIKTYKTIDNIYNHLSDLKPKQRESMEEFRSRYQQNLELVRIKCDVPILPVLTPFKQDNRVAEVFKAYGLHSLSERISKISGEMEQLSWF